MKLKVHISLALLILLITNEFGGVMNVQGRSRVGGSRSGSSSSSGTSSRTSYHSSSFGSSRTYSWPILRRNYGGYSGQQSTSTSGFGLGEFGRFDEFLQIQISLVLHRGYVPKKMAILSLKQAFPCYSRIVKTDNTKTEISDGRLFCRG